jgi:hypothetical protein
MRVKAIPAIEPGSMREGTMKRIPWVRIALTAAVVSVVAVAVAEAAGPFQFYSVTPCRIVDTRNPNGVTGGPALTAGSPRNFPINVSPAACGVDAAAKAVTLNVTIVSPTADGFLTIWPYNTSLPTVSTINASAGEPALANGAIVPLTTDPSFNASVVYGTAGGGTAHVILDVTGYFK